MNAVRLSAVLLAGGESRRMGRDKATVEFAGRPLWQTQIATLKELAPLGLFISSRTDPPWRPRDMVFVADTQPSVGPLSGIAASLGQMRGTHLVVLGIDLPFMTAPYLQSLYDRCAPGSGTVPIIEERAEPLAAIYPVETGHEFARALRGTDHSLQPLVRQLAQAGKVSLMPVPAEKRSFFRNLNSPEDLNQ